MIHHHKWHDGQFFRRALACVLLALVAARSLGQEVSPKERVFFAFDDHQLAWKHNLRLTMQQPTKHPANPVLRCGPKGSPDYGHAILYGSVLQIGGKFRMWYLGMIQRELEGGQAPGWWRPMCYAESDDGVRWTKPELNLVELNGNKRNNICLIEGTPASMTRVNDFLSVMFDAEEADPNRRYKCAYLWYSHWDCEGQFRSQEIGLATIRRDGFACLSRHDAGDPGHVVSSVVAPGKQGAKVRVNVAGVSDGAPIHVELLDASDQPIPGFSGQDAARVTIDAVRADVTWPAGATAPTDRPFAIKVTLPDDDNAQLYAIYVESL